MSGEIKCFSCSYSETEDEYWSASNSDLHRFEAKIDGKIRSVNICTNCANITKNKEIEENAGKRIITIPLSGCCHVEIKEENEWKCVCSKCGEHQVFVFGIEKGTGFRSNDAPGVWQDWNNNLFFGHHCAGTLKSFKEIMEYGQDLVCIAKDGALMTIESAFNKDADMISSAAHEQFRKEWEPKVANPNFGK